MKADCHSIHYILCTLVLYKDEEIKISKPSFDWYT
jgi:hypothetical protein